MEKVNVCGNGISISRPIGAAGCVLAAKVFYELRRTGKKDAVISMYFTKM